MLYRKNIKKTVAFIVIVRVKGLTDLSLGDSSWTQGFLLAFGLLSVALPAFILIVQQHYKRMLAYSSIEHMGLIAFALGLGPVGAIPAVFHIVGHSLSKSLLFFLSGDIILRWKSGQIANVRDMAKHAPITATLFLIGILAILAVPPSPLFLSEVLMIGYGMRVAPVLTILLLLALTIVFVSMMQHVGRMIFSPKTDDNARAPHGERGWNTTLVVAAVQLCLLFATSIFFMTETGWNLVATIASRMISL